MTEATKDRLINILLVIVCVTAGLFCLYAISGDTGSMEKAIWGW